MYRNPPRSALASDAIAPRSVPDPALAAVLRRLRNERGLSRETLAHGAGISLNTYTRIENSLASPGWSIVRRLAEALGVSLAELGRMVEAER